MSNERVTSYPCVGIVFVVDITRSIGTIADPSVVESRLAVFRLHWLPCGNGRRRDAWPLRAFEFPGTRPATRGAGRTPVASVRRRYVDDAPVNATHAARARPMRLAPTLPPWACSARILVRAAEAHISSPTTLYAGRLGRAPSRKLTPRGKQMARLGRTTDKLIRVRRIPFNGRRGGDKSV